VQRRWRGPRSKQAPVARKRFCNELGAALVSRGYRCRLARWSAQLCARRRRSSAPPGARSSPAFREPVTPRDEEQCGQRAWSGSLPASKGLGADRGRYREVDGVGATITGEDAVSDRIRCAVPFCRRTTARFRPPTEWICGDHWRLVPKVMRRVHGRRYHHEHDGIACDRLWALVKRSAIEAAGGIR
jgi:hypothetical protein